MNKLLSIIVPSYNMEKYLSKCLDSLLLDDFELLQKLDVIVVNDGSKDRTSEIAHRYETEYPGVFVVVDKANGHYGSCVNVALPVAKGKYVRLLDADDYFDRTGFMVYVKWLAEVSETLDPDCVVSDFCYVDDAGCVKSTTHYGFPADRLFTPNESLEFCGINIGVHAVAHRLQILRATGFRQTEGMPYTDTEWSFLPMFNVRRMAYFPQTVKCYLEGREGQTMSSDQLRANAAKYAAVAERIFEEYGCAHAGEIPECGRYCRYVVEELIKWILSIYLLAPSGGALDKEVSKRFDDALQRYAPDIYKTSEGFAASKIRFRYVRAWRRSGYDDSAIAFRLYRLYQAVIRKIRR